jgi:hypothetical protein
MKVDKDVMALLKATKKASEPPAVAIERIRKTFVEHSPLEKFPEPDRNVESLPTGPASDG